MKHTSLIAFSIAAALSNSAFADNTTSSKNGSFKSTFDDSQFKINGRIMFDLDNFDGVQNNANDGNTGSQSEIRRSRIAVTSQLSKQWKAKLQVDYNDAKKEASLKDAYIQHKGNIATITIGKHKEPMGLEELTSSKYITTIERAMVTDAFAPSRSMGVSAKGGNDMFLWQGGIFKSGSDATNDNRETYATTGRVVFTPTHEKTNLIHLGASFSQRNLGSNTYQFEERAEVHTAEKTVISDEVTDADSARIYGLEAATVQGALSVQAEYYKTDISAKTGDDASFDGYYVLGSYFLTGESRPYKNGAFGKVKPNSVDGAWEIIARYSVLDGRDNDAGTEGENMTIGLNYYLNANMRFMANYIDTTITSATPTKSDGDAISMRFQYIW